MNRFAIGMLIMTSCTASLDASDSDTSNPGQETDTTDNESLFELFGDQLTCTSISYCTNYNGNLDVVEMPEQLGGNVPDGLYRAVKGANPPFGYAFYKGRYSLIRQNVAVSHGTVEFDGTLMKRSPTVACTSEVEAELDLEQQRNAKSTTEYAIQGDTLYTRSVCGSPDPSQCSFPTMLKRVSNMCEGIEQNECTQERCECETFTDGVIPSGPTPDNACQI